ncbi:MAG: single-stranded-DNA-specific exonuclease RecJ [Bacteroidetes bacterium]|nr:single-stranded-DNA-specific exonuclease RecJ [Bacteroidota bacterium]
MKRWSIKQTADKSTVEKLGKMLNVSEPIAQLLYQRNLTDFEDAKIFFRPDLNNLHNPFLMKDMDAAVTRIQKAIAGNQKILIYGDYDVDGTTAVALVYSFLSTIYSNLDYYIPDRYAEGYGISFQGIDFAKQNSFDLIIALDCGIKSHDKIEYANSLGIDFIICDHHRPGETIPAAVAVLDPKREDCSYPFKELSGCGVGFKLMQALCIKLNIDVEKLYPYLDLVVVSTAADIVPIYGENRILAYYGLKQVNANPRPGIRAILELNKIKKQLSVSDLVFYIGPRINAAGRIDKGKRAVELLISKTKKEAEEFGAGINTSNTERKTIDSTITQEALALIAADENFGSRKSTVLFNPGWHKGVIGIVASRLIEKYYKPTIILTESNGKATGSARSVKDFDVYEAIDACSDLLEQFGGHKYAAGLTMLPENVDAFIQRFEQVVSSTIQDHLLIPEVEIDVEVDFKDITTKFYNVLKQFAPFGPDNMNPVFVTRGVICKGYARIVGETHIKFDVFQPESKESIFSAIGFGLAGMYDKIQTSVPFDICYTIEENDWNGIVNLQLNIKDIRFLE